MVQLTRVLLKYKPDWYHVKKTSGKYFGKQNLFFLTRYHTNLAWHTIKNARNRYDYMLKGEMFYRNRLSLDRMDINRARIAAACEEYDYSYPYLKSTLPKLDINLNLNSLAHLAIYEPKTFRCLVDICKEYTKNPLPPSNFNADRL